MGLVLAQLWLFVSAGAVSAAPPTPLVSALSELKRTEDTFFLDQSSESLTHFSSRLEGQYIALFRAELARREITTLSAEELESAFDAMYLTAFYAESAAIAEDMKPVFAEMARRGLDSSERASDFFHAYILAHRFGDARDLARHYSHASLPRIPEIHLATGPGGAARVFALKDDVLRLEGLSWDTGPRVLMLFSPTCGPSNEAISVIEADERLLEGFRRHSLLITSPHSLMSLTELAKWQRTHPELRAFIAYSASDWPQFPRWGTPHFLFFLNGTLLMRVDGWRPSVSDQAADLLRGMERIGILPSRSRSDGMENRARKGGP